MFAEWLRQLRTWIDGRRFDAELDEEMQFHRDMHEQELRESGLSPAEAKRQANLSFGSGVAAREESRESWGFAWLDSMGQDLRYGLRQLNRNRGFAATAILTIALGVGASAAIFTLVNAVLLKPLPYPEPDRLFVLYESISWNGRDPITRNLGLHHRKRELKSFSALGAYGRSRINWRSPEGVVGLNATAVDFDLMTALGFQPAMGRTFTAQEEREAANVIILSYATWVAQFGADPAVVGSTGTFDDEAFTIIGVARPEFRVDWVGSNPPEAYTLLSRNPAYRTNGQGHNSWRYVARLAPGVTAEQARAEWESLQAAWVADQPTEWLRQEPIFQSFAEQTFEYYRPRLLTLAGAGALVFLIVCANLAGLLLARSVARRREIGVRASLGAARGRIARQLSVEAALLAALGGGAGLLLCVWTFYGFKSLIHFYLPRLDTAAIGPETLLFAAGASVVCAALGGMTPLLARSFSSPWDSIRSDASGTNARRKGRRTADALVVAQFALSLTLIVGASLLARTFWNLMQTDWGFDGDGLTAALLVAPREISDDARALSVLGDELAEGIAVIPGVDQVALGPGPPVRGFHNIQEIIIGAQRNEPLPRADLQAVSPNYFEVMRIGLLSGRPLLVSDDEGSSRVAVIDETFAERYWPGKDPLGQTFEVESTKDEFQSVVVVGVARRIFRSSLQSGAFPIAYLPYRQQVMHNPTAVFRFAQDRSALTPAIRRMTAELSVERPIEVWTVAEQMDYSYAEPRFYMALLSAFALLALALAAVGLYGVVAYSVRARTAEIGLRLAVGAAPAEILRMVLRRGIRLAAIGLVLGSALAWVGVRSIEGLLFGVSAADPLTLAAVCLLLFATALLACWIPARRAASIEPVSALRQE